MTEQKLNSSSSSELDSSWTNHTANSSTDEKTPSHKSRIDENNMLRVPIGGLNEYITCGICKGYLYEASTITECMHSFCKNCIVKHIQRSLQCPSCQILIHPTDPFVHIRLDRLLQDIVHGLLPKVYEEELQREKNFYAEHGYEVPERPLQGSGRAAQQSQIRSSQQRPFKSSLCPFVFLTLKCKCSSPLDKKLEKKFIQVKGEATINNVVTFLRKKLILSEDHVVEMFCTCAEGSMCLESNHTLLTVKEQFSKEEDFLHLEYEVSPRQWLD